jgi:hypothetical protein
MRQHYRHTNVGRPRRPPSPQWADRSPCPVLWAPGQGPARSAIASSSTAAALTVEHEDVGNSRRLQKICRVRICRQDPEMNGDYVAVRTTVYNARTYRDADTLIGPTTGPCPYGINISMLDGDIVPSTRSKSTSGISTRKEFSSGSALALPSASHASPPSKLQPSGTSLGSPFCSASAPVQHSNAIRNRISRCKMSNLVALGRGRSRHCTWA